MNKLKVIILLLVIVSLCCVYYLFKVEHVIEANPTEEIEGTYIGTFPAATDTIAIGNTIKTVIGNEFGYLLDQRQNSILQFDLDGNFIQKVGRTGRGPGELIMPLSISGDDSALYTFEQDKMQIQTFRHDGKYKDLIQFRGAFEDITVSDSSIWMVNHYFEGMPPFMDMPDTEGQPIFTILDLKDYTFHAIGSYPEIYDKLGWQKGGVLVDSFEDKIFTAFPLLPEIKVYDTNTSKFSETIKLNSPELDNQYERLLSSQTPKFSFRSISVNEQGIFLPVFGESMNIYHFNFDGTLNSIIKFGSFYEREENDHYIRHLNTFYNQETEQVRLFANIYSSDYPRTVIVEADF